MKKCIVKEKNGVLKNFFLLYINVSFGKKGYKYFIGYKDYDYKTKRLCNASKNEWICKKS